ncbi:winged helix DNA-binding protein [Fulvivirga sp. M361]|uniref:MarR family winged helix-turn-helix transcriptional regulator n=1 Tax=Fulvivirga sp. M361 TaxID=2594266 RepID=UPI001179CA42|nr:MarR family transcriptional regulator [Fulvivirga sp. M361]TRX59362.1 winged helix DNA-binding protein [Fulvivirga sp. M361]
MDYLKSLQLIGVTARIKRISDKLMHDARRVYDYLDLPIEPNWHLVFLLLKEEKQLSVTEISGALKFSHPAIINIIKKMKASGYVTSTTDPKDSRKQIVQLTEKARKELPNLEAEWDKIKIAVGAIFNDEFLEQLVEVEENMTESDLLDRVIEIKAKRNE